MVRDFESWQKILLKCGVNAGWGLLMLGHLVEKVNAQKTDFPVIRFTQGRGENQILKVCPVF